MLNPLTTNRDISFALEKEPMIYCTLFEIQKKSDVFNLFQPLVLEIDIKRDDKC